MQARVLPARRERSLADDSNLGTGGSPHTRGAGVSARRRWPWQTTAFSVHGGAGAPAEGKDVVLPDVYCFSFRPKVPEHQGAPTRSPRTF